MEILVAAAAAADTATYLLLPPGGEANPVVLALGPLAALTLKALLAATLIALARRHLRYFRAVLPIAATAWIFGTATNIWTILSSSPR